MLYIFKDIYFYVQNIYPSLEFSKASLLKNDMSGSNGVNM